MIATRNQLSVLQFNVCRGHLSTDQLSKDALTKNLDIIALQEPHINIRKVATHNPLQDKEYFHLVRIPNLNFKARTATYVSKQIPRDSWHVAHESRDPQAIRISFGNRRTVYIHNIYNDCHTPTSPGVCTLRKFRDQLNITESRAEHLIIGNFSLQSPRWEGSTYEAQYREESEERLSDLYLPS